MKKKNVKKVEPKYTLVEFAEHVDSEGLDYAVLHYFGRDITAEVDDKELVELWAQAYDILEKINTRIEDALESYKDDELEENN